MRALLVVTIALNLVGCAEDSVSVTCPGEGDYEYADQIVEAPGGVTTPAAIDEPDNAVNGVVDGAPKSGGLDVYSRGLSTDPPNNFITLRWSDRRVVNGPGADVVVFENAFETSGGTFMDPAVVEVSNDGERWVAFPFDYVADNEAAYSRAEADWIGFAGITPVRWDSSTCTDPFGAAAGGDRFDLDDLDDATLSEGFRYLRITAAATVTNPDTGQPFVKDFLSDGFDLDGVYARTTEPQ